MTVVVADVTLDSVSSLVSSSEIVVLTSTTTFNSSEPSTSMSKSSLAALVYTIPIMGIVVRSLSFISYESIV